MTSTLEIDVIYNGGQKSCKIRHDLNGETIAIAAVDSRKGKAFDKDSVTQLCSIPVMDITNE